MNWIGVKSIYLHEMDRMKRTIIQSILSPVISTSLYFVVFGSAIGSRIPLIEDIFYCSGPDDVGAFNTEFIKCCLRNILS